MAALMTKEPIRPDWNTGHVAAINDILVDTAIKKKLRYQGGCGGVGEGAQWSMGTMV